MRISDWSSGVCSSDLDPRQYLGHPVSAVYGHQPGAGNRTQHGHITAGIGHNINQNLRLKRKSDAEGKSVSVRVDLGGRRLITKKTTFTNTTTTSLPSHSTSGF